MSFLRNHMVLMFIYAVAAGVFFALLWREDRPARIRLFLIIFVSLFLGGIVLGWVMFPLPLNR